MRPKLFAVALAVLFGSAVLSPARAETPEERAQKLIDDAGGIALRDDAAPGKPVVAVSLCGAKVSDDLLKSLAAFPQLRTVDLCRAEGMTSKRARLLADVKLLESLNVSRCADLTGHGLYKLSALKNLRVLDVSYCPEIDDCGLEALAEYFPKLRSLDISGCTSLTARGLKELRAIEGLEVLHAGHANLDDAAVKEIATLTKLRALSLRGAQRATLTGMRSLVTLVDLEVLDLSDSNATTSAVLAPLCLKLTKLHTLSIANCPRLANHTLNMLRNAKNLQTLNISGFPHLETYGLEYLVRSAPNLRALDITGCGEVNDDGMRVLAKLGQLERLDVRGCKGISANGAKVIADAKPNLKLDR
ncbi:MAG: hypothetical protein FJ304_09150 [Planctomycetes bacterium]|nr:hypothetical protein [Planctomycetota bacterium]